MSREPIEWTEAHKREAERRTYEIAANLSPCEPLAAHNLARGANECAERASAWRGLLLVALSSLPDADVLRVSARIDRETRRVDALATGRLVRETGYEIGVRTKDGFHMQAWRPDLDAAEKARDTNQHGPHIVRVTRIRRAK